MVTPIGVASFDLTRPR